MGTRAFAGDREQGAQPHATPATPAAPAAPSVILTDATAARRVGPRTPSEPPAASRPERASRTPPPAAAPWPGRAASARSRGRRSSFRPPARRARRAARGPGTRAPLAGHGGQPLRRPAYVGGPAHRRTPGRPTQTRSCGATKKPRRTRPSGGPGPRLGNEVVARPGLRDAHGPAELAPELLLDRARLRAAVEADALAAVDAAREPLDRAAAAPHDEGTRGLVGRGEAADRRVRRRSGERRPGAEHPGRRSTPGTSWTASSASGTGRGSQPCGTRRASWNRRASCGSRSRVGWMPSWSAGTAPRTRRPGPHRRRPPAVVYAVEWGGDGPPLAHRVREPEPGRHGQMGRRVPAPTSDVPAGRRPPGVGG